MSKFGNLNKGREWQPLGLFSSGVADIAGAGLSGDFAPK